MIRLTPEDAKIYEVDEAVLADAGVAVMILNKSTGKYSIMFEDGRNESRAIDEIPWIKRKANPEVEPAPKAEEPIVKAKPVEPAPAEEPVEEKPLPKEEAKEIEKPLPEEEEPAPAPAVEEVVEPVFTKLPPLKEDKEEIPHGFGHVWQKEDEDAPPFRDATIVLASDGLGGGGNTKVRFALDEETKGKFIAAAFIGMDELEGDDRLTAYCHLIVDDIFSPEKAEGGKISMSQAAFASRVITARFAYCKRHGFADYSEAFDIGAEEARFKKFVKPGEKLPSLMGADLSDASYRQKVSAFLTYGLRKIIAALNMPEPDPFNPLLAYTPATLASAIIRHHGNKIDLEVLWAGDSRVYAIDAEKGFQQLSLDNEDENGGKMTNKFRGDFLADLYYAKYENLPENCIVFACSDGVFDPFPEFEPLAVKANLIEAMPPLGPKFDFEEWKVAFFKRYARFRGDDISIALNCYGYEDSDYFKLFGMDDKSIVDKFEEVWSKKNSIQEIAAKRRGENPADREYFQTRTASLIRFGESKMLSYLAKLVDIYFDEVDSGKHDLVLTPEIKRLIEDAKPSTEPTEEEKNEFYYGLIKSAFGRDPEELSEVLEKGQLKKFLSEYLDKLKPEWLYGKKYSLTFSSIEDSEIGLRIKLDIESDVRRAKESAESSKEEFLSRLERAKNGDELLENIKDSYLLRNPVPKKVLTRDQLKEAIVKNLYPHLEEVTGLIAKALEDNYTETSAIEPGFFNSDKAQKCRDSIALEKSLDESLVALYEYNVDLSEKSFERRVEVLGE